MSARPRRVRINGEDFAIRYRKFRPAEHAIGQCQYKKALIEVSSEQTPFNTRDILLHEIMHALLVKQGHVGQCFDNYSTEEKYVNALASGVVSVLQDNTELALWLIEPAGRKTP